MKTKIDADGKEILDGDQTFIVFMDIYGQEITDEVFIQHGTLKSDAENLIDLALDAMKHSAITSGWRPK